MNEPNPMRVTIRSAESGTLVSRARVENLYVLGLFFASLRIDFKRLHFEDDEVEVTTATFREAVELFDELTKERKEKEK